MLPKHTNMFLTVEQSRTQLVFTPFSEFICDLWACFSLRNILCGILCHVLQILRKQFSFEGKMNLSFQNFSLVESKKEQNTCHKVKPKKKETHQRCGSPCLLLSESWPQKYERKWELLTLAVWVFQSREIVYISLSGFWKWIRRNLNRYRL